MLVRGPQPVPIYWMHNWWFELHQKGGQAVNRLCEWTDVVMVRGSPGGEWGLQHLGRGENAVEEPAHRRHLWLILHAAVWFLLMTHYHSPTTEHLHYSTELWPISFTSVPAGLDHCPTSPQKQLLLENTPCAVFTGSFTFTKLLSEKRHRRPSLCRSIAQQVSNVCDMCQHMPHSLQLWS